jgi:tight adherence protein B
VSGLAVVLTGVAVALFMRPPRAGPEPRLGAKLAPAYVRQRRWQALAVGSIGGALLVFDGTRLALALIALGCAGAALVLVRRARRARAAELRQALVVEVCEALVGELRAGLPLLAALERCVELWPALEPVAAAGRLGADVPSALRSLSTLGGAEGLREVASAWQVAADTGTGLAVALDHVARTARERQATRHLVLGELASAQATARLVAVLPVASLAMSTGIGGDPWRFLLATPAGLTCLTIGACLAWLGLLWIDRIAAAVLTD